MEPKAKKKKKEKKVKLDATCHLCEKTFARPAYLKFHEKTAHNSEKSFKCDQCEKSFSLQDYLKSMWRGFMKV